MSKRAAAVTSRGFTVVGAMLLAAMAAPPLLSAQNAAPDASPGIVVEQQKATAEARQSEIPESALAGEHPESMGRIVEEVRVTAAGEQPEAWLKKLPIQPGDRLERGKLRESLRTLYRSGRFADLETDAKLLPSGGVAVEFRTTPRYFSGSVTVSGFPKGGPGEIQVVSTGRLELGSEFNEAKLKGSEERILRLLHDSGYWRAEVRSELQRHEEIQQVDVHFRIVPGPQARMGKLTVTGDPALSSEEAMRITHMRPGRHVRRELLQRGVERLRRRYVKQNRLRADVTAQPPVYRPENNTVDYSIAVDRGPVVEIGVEGYKLPRSKLKRYVPVWEEHAVDEDLLNEGRRNLRDYLESQGYFHATVQVRQDEDPEHDRQRIVYTIAPREKHRLRAIEIQGNKRFNRATLRERMGTRVSSFLLKNGRYSQSLTNQDLKAIESLYQSNGYAHVKVTSEVIEDWQGRRGDMKLVVKIEEGWLVRVGRLDIRGAHAVSEEELRGLINTREGQPFSEATIADDRDVVLTYYFNHGFQSVQLESAAKYAPGSQELMDVVMEIREGPQQFVKKVLVSGVHHTRRHVVDRAVVIEPGAPLSQEKMFLTQRNFYDLRLFTEVKTAIQNPEGEEAYKNVLFQTQEAKRWTFEYGGGIEAGSGLNTSTSAGPQGTVGVSPRGTFNLTRINFRGRDESIIFKSHFGTLQKRASLSFDQQHWFDLPNWRLTLTGLYDNTRDVNTFTSSRAEVSVQLTQKVSKATQLLYRFAYRRVSVDPNSFPPGFSENNIQLFSRPVKVGMPSLIYLRDRRDDPVSSTKGTYITTDVGLANSAFGSEANFGRFLAQHSSYYKLRHGWVFARSLRVGVESPYSGTTIIPLPERFFVGGSNSHRGFAINQAGPRDLNSGFPLGGNAMIVNNLELRTPPVPLPFVGDNLSFVLFHDMGNSFDTATNMWENLWRYSQKDTSSDPADLQSCRNLDLNASCDFSYVSHAIGAGIRYRTPIGPVRVDLGYNINPPVFPVKQPCLGVTPPCPSDPAGFVDQVHHFNFFFSIGQTF
jgi:outer membrane protein insertion porin family